MAQVKIRIYYLLYCLLETSLILQKKKTEMTPLLYLKEKLVLVIFRSHPNR